MLHILKKLASRWLALRRPAAPLPPATTGADVSIDSRNCGLADAVISGWYRGDTGELLRGFRIGPADTVLDVGCGEGGATLFAARCGAEVIFIDSDAEKIDALRVKMGTATKRTWRGIVCDADPLPLPDGSASKIIAMEVLEHVKDPSQVMRELVRVSAPGAQFLISVPDPAGEMLQKTVAPPAHFLEPNHVRIFQRDEFEKLIVDSGLMIEQKHYSGFFWSMWMCFYWVSLRASGGSYDGATRDQVVPPHHILLDQWARTWQTLIDMPDSAELKAAFDEFMPKSQTIIARKPMA